MKRVLPTFMLVCLTLCAASAFAGQSGRCSPEGTWYGYNDAGAVWIVTINRSGPDSYTTVMDSGANLNDPPVAQSTDWRGEFVALKTADENTFEKDNGNSKQYAWTTMALLRGDETSQVPFALGVCPLLAEFTSCDSWQGAGVCHFYGFFEPDDDPFADGFYLFSGEPLLASFKRMPMTAPAP